ncbi:hypothetical protein B0H15DRAFT_64982 [Mycena belliarum]|uniref:Cytochrome b561 domain-containing protein n=1 Tax=Mycena belliarum TaxID=1033014 RepID=A0AAD6TMM2_9AGAR|nr:hypothetical protein B0H15DRAFT_64982 [Mycena belliae]
MSYGYGAPAPPVGGGSSIGGSTSSGNSNSSPAQGGSTPSGAFSPPLTDIEIMARTHALLCSVGFLVLLPLGVLFARYARNFTHTWFWGHATLQLVVAGPVIFAGWAQGHTLAGKLGLLALNDRHQQIGIALLALYVTQLLLGAFIHLFKMPALFRGHRPPQNYLHGALGLALLALAAYQVHYGLTIEWLFTGGLHKVPASALHAWMALIIIFWMLYVLGMALLPRQLARERAGRQTMRVSAKEGTDVQA